MYKFIAVSVIAIVILQGALAKPAAKPKAPATSPIDELAVNARELVQNVSKVIEGNLPDSKQVSQTLTESTQNLADKVKSAVDDLSKQASEHKGDVENILNTIKESLSSTATKLQEAVGPEATKKAKELKASFDEGVNKLISDAEKLAKSAEPEIGKARDDINNVAKNLLDQIVEVSKNLKTNLDKSVAPSN